MIKKQHGADKWQCRDEEILCQVTCHTTRVWAACTALSVLTPTMHAGDRDKTLPDTYHTTSTHTRGEHTMRHTPSLRHVTKCRDEIRWAHTALSLSTDNEKHVCIHTVWCSTYHTLCSQWGKHTMSLRYADNWHISYNESQQGKHVMIKPQCSQRAEHIHRVWDMPQNADTKRSSANWHNYKESEHQD